MIKKFWHNISFIGLEDKDEFKYREVVLLNKIVFMATFTMFILVPIEVSINGWEMVLYELSMGFLCLLSLVFTHFKLYTFSKIYFFFITMSIIAFMGIVVGAGTGNEMFMLPTFIFPLILFNKRKVVFSFAFIAMAAFFVIIWIQSRTTPLVEIPEEVRSTFKYIFYAIIFVLTFFEVYYFKGINYRFQDILGLQKKEIEDKNKEIVDSITYAKRIQSAILPSDTLVNSLLPDAFIMYKPKDIVAGDFYWLEQKGDLVIFAAADCTGHGVPGAMVSVVCDNALKKAVHEFGLTDPGEILDKTKEIVTDQFIKGTEDVKDGMDIALCVWNKKENTVRYAGANNPLWIIRANNSTIEEIKPTKQPIGKSDHSSPFESHLLNINSGDRIYIFSDGYADQFGGDKGKKFKYKSLKDLFVQIKDESMTEQKVRLERVFEEWKGEFEQLDDVCVIGVRF